MADPKRHRVRIKLDFVVETEADPNELLNPLGVPAASLACAQAFEALAENAKLEGRYHVLGGTKFSISLVGARRG